MAKVSVKGFLRLNKVIKRVFSKDIFTEKLIKQVGEFSVERVRSFTRSGYSIAGERKKRLKKLSKSYIATRMGAVKFRTMKDGRVVGFQEPDPILKDADPEFFDPSFSNLTMTGQLLNSLKFFFNRRKKMFTVEPTGKRKLSEGQTKRLSNKQVAEFVSSQGRPFLGMDNKGVTTIKNMIRKEIRTQLRKNNLNKRTTRR